MRPKRTNKEGLPSMHPFVLISLLACVVLTSYCLTVSPSSLDASDRRRARLGRLLFGCPALWALCEVGWSVGGSAEAGMPFTRPAMAAILLIAPVSVEMALALAVEPGAALRTHIRWLYAVAAVLIGVAWTTDSFFQGLAPVPWGWVPDPGPFFIAYCAFVLGCAVYAFYTCRRVMRDALDVQATLSGRSVVVGIFALMCVGTLTDVILPLLDVQVPRLSTASFAALAAVALWSRSRPQGYVFASQASISREILRSLHEGVVFLTLDDRVLLANEGMATMLGVDEDDLVGQPFQQYLPTQPLEHRQQRIDVECELRRLDGNAVAVAVSLSAVRDQRGTPLGLVVVVRDLREVKQLRGRLITSGRLAAVGQLAAGIAHEINNPIAFVRTNLSVLREYWSDLGKELAGRQLDDRLAEILHDGEEIIDESVEGVDRAAAIVRDVREFSQAGSAEREMVELPPLLDRVIRVASPEIGPGVTIAHSHAEVPAVPASPQQLKQVFLSILMNAVEAVGGQGRVEIDTTCEDEEVVVRIADDGHGIAPELVDRVFDPFFTTKSVGKGTGLGLSIAHEIVRAHDGVIQVEPGREVGACLCVRLPTRCTEGMKRPGEGGGLSGPGTTSGRAAPAL